MRDNRHTWVIVLTSSVSRRLRALTRDGDGRDVPKVFCSLRGGRTLFGDALVRASALASPERVLPVLCAADERWWRGEVRELPPANVLVEPSERGDGASVLRATIHALQRDPEANVVVLRADHHVAAEAPLRVSIEMALQLCKRSSGVLALLAVEPDAAGPLESSGEHDWIVPIAAHAPRSHGATLPGVWGRIERFVEHPSCELAAELAASGALWNASIVAGAGSTWLRAFARRAPTLVQALLVASRQPLSRREAALREAYDAAAPLELLHGVLEPELEHLRVLVAAPCGWTDLATPQRLVACLKRENLGREHADPAERSPVLAEELSRRLAPRAIGA